MSHGAPEQFPINEATHELALRAELTAIGADSEQLSTLEVFQTERAPEVLDWAVHHGFVLHGTTRLVDGEFLPHQANDTEKESGNRNAVYMTDVPEFAMFKALTGGVERGNFSGMTRHGISITEDDDGTVHREFAFQVTDPAMIVDAGLVYLFEAGRTNEHVGGEYLSYSPIKPVAALRFNREQFAHPIEIATS